MTISTLTNRFFELGNLRRNVRTLDPAVIRTSSKNYGRATLMISPLYKHDGYHEVHNVDRKH